MKRMNSVPLERVSIKDRFWADRQDLVREHVIPYQWEALNDRIPDVEPSHAIENFRIAAGESEGEFGGRVFQDSDVAKWLEAVSYSLVLHPDSKLEARADEVIDLVVKAQQPDGYLNTYFTVAEPNKRWTNLRDWHELYCAGHMIEAAVAYHQATGKRKLLDAMCRFVDHIDSIFGREEGKKRGYPGHPEIELALVKLYRATGERRYLDLAGYFVDERGRRPHWYEIEGKARGDHSLQHGDLGPAYSQAHLPIREQTTIEGHSVRALYLLSGAADVAAETGDETLVEACKRLWKNATERRMYVTGAVGSEAYGERFTFDYDLPNDRAYAETCANIALVFFASRMLALEADAAYADVMERALYNGVLSGISLDGKAFFYVNPLEVWPEAAKRRRDHRHVKTVRQGWFDCACCPPNIARLVASLGGYLYSQNADTAYVHLYASGEATLEVASEQVRLEVETDYPWDGEVRVAVHPDEATEFTLALRIPGWCEGGRLTVDGAPVDLGQVVRKGYAYIKRRWQSGDEVRLTLPMPIRRVYSDPRVRENAGKVAIQRGPLVYCLEEVDNGPNLPGIVLPAGAELEASWDGDLLGGCVVITGAAMREEAWEDGPLYRSEGQKRMRPTSIKAVPYALWCNRTPGEMLVWVREA